MGDLLVGLFGTVLSLVGLWAAFFVMGWGWSFGSSLVGG